MYPDHAETNRKRMRVHYKEQQAIEWAKTQEGWAKQREENAQHKAEKAVALTATREANAERATTAKQEARMWHDRYVQRLQNSN